MYDTVLGSWLPFTTRVTLQANVSTPVLVVDAPTVGQAVAQPFAATGYAIDRGVTSGTGVDMVSTWGYPNPGSGAAPMGGTTGTYGTARPDVAIAPSARTPRR